MLPSISPVDDEPGAQNEVLEQNARPKTRLFGLDIDRLTPDQATRIILEWAAQRPPKTVVTPNLDHIDQLSGNPDFAPRLSFC